MNNFEELKRRGYIYQSNNIEEVENLINNKRIVFYLGIDPTASSIHLGHFFPITLVRRLQKMGHKPILVLGGGTALIGDPSGRDKERKILSNEEIDNNFKKIKSTLENYLDFEGENACIIVNNNDWIKNLNFINFMRDFGIYFNVNEMLRMDSCKTRLDAGGLTFLEMSYSLLQAYDFYHLNEEYDCILQIGGSDQWSNILSGINLINKKQDKKVYGLTCPLLVSADGKKMGKTLNNALWIDKELLSTYDFYQELINFDDRDVKKMLMFFTDLSIEKIDEILNLDIRDAKKQMAYEVTKFIRGEEEASKARKTSEEVFNQGDSSNMPSFEFHTDLEKMNILDFLKEIEIVPSKSEARRNVEQGGIRINDERIDDINYSVNLLNEEIIVRKGKKKYLKVIIK